MKVQLTLLYRFIFNHYYDHQDGLKVQSSYHLTLKYTFLFNQNYQIILKKLNQILTIRRCNWLYCISLFSTIILIIRMAWRCNWVTVWLWNMHFFSTNILKSTKYWLSEGAIDYHIALHSTIIIITRMAWRCNWATVWRCWAPGCWVWATWTGQTAACTSASLPTRRTRRRLRLSSSWEVSYNFF